jgi:hypothetical protein
MAACRAARGCGENGEPVVGPYWGVAVGAYLLGRQLNCRPNSARRSVFFASYAAELPFQITGLEGSEFRRTENKRLKTSWITVKDMPV